MKPFNLDAAISGKKVITRDGREVKIAGVNRDADPEEAVAGWVKTDENTELYGWHINGRCLFRKECPGDLFMAPEKKEYWAALIRKEGNTWYECGHSESEVIGVAAASKADVLSVHKIWEEDV